MIRAVVIFSRHSFLLGDLINIPFHPNQAFVMEILSSSVHETGISVSKVGEAGSYIAWFSK